jgi:hypothetical protein
MAVVPVQMSGVWCVEVQAEEGDHAERRHTTTTPPIGVPDPRRFQQNPPETDSRPRIESGS